MTELDEHYRHLVVDSRCSQCHAAASFMKDEIERLKAERDDWYMRALKADDALHRLQGCDIDNAAQDIIIATLEPKP